jgi:hypothetical protein
LLFKLISGAALALALCGGVRAADFTVAAFGDTPYSADEEKSFTLLIAEMNREKLAFVVHIGDFKASWQPCSDELFKQRRDWFDLFHHPFVFVPGDNEWTDCSRLMAGRYDPLERLSKLREMFAQGAESLGQRRIPLARQSKDFPEHARWEHQGALFATLNKPGSGNGGLPEERERRNRAVEAWISQTFKLAAERKLRAVVIFVHANPINRLGRFRPDYAGMMETLVAGARNFKGEVLLVHGDTHTYRVDQPLRYPSGAPRLDNFTRVEVFGYPVMNWVRIRVIDDGKRVRFEVKPGS